MFAENLVDFVGVQLFVQFIGHVLGRIAHNFLHSGGHIYAVALLQYVTHAAFARLGVDSDYVGVVLPAHVVGVYRKVGHVPDIKVLLLPPFHTLCNRVLMRTREGGKHQLARVRLAGIYCHSRKGAVQRAYIGHIFKVEAGVYALREHIHSKRDHVYVARALAVAEQGALYSVRTRK